MPTHDVVIIGARCAGATAAAELARSGLDVVVLDRARFPSDTLSTHVLFGGGIEELKHMGAFEKVLEHDPSYLRDLEIHFDGKVHVHEAWGTSGETDYVMCIPRPIQDAILVETAREHGADVREGWEFLDVLWRGGRVCGVRAKDSTGEIVELQAQLVIGADGRTSTVAARVGSWRPYRSSKNGRGLVFRYLDDPRVGTRLNETLSQWRDGDSFCMVFPSAPRPRTIALVMGPASDVARARKDPDGVWDEFLRRHPGFAERIEGATNLSKLRSTADVPAYFRSSSGPGWALAGDAGHFKDPVIGNGQRDAMWMGRSLGARAAEAIGDPARLDAALRRWEQERDEECLSVYHFANSETRIQPQSPVLVELARRAKGRHGPDLGDIFQRVRSQQEVLPLTRMASGFAGALAHDVRHEPRALPQTLRDGLADLWTDLQVREEARARRFRSTRRVWGSEHLGVEWPEPPRRPKAPAAASAERLRPLPATRSQEAAPPPSAGRPRSSGVAGEAAAPADSAAVVA